VDSSFTPSAATAAATIITTTTTPPIIWLWSWSWLRPWAWTLVYGIVSWWTTIPLGLVCIVRCAEI
jgi:hypothetical protein